MIKLGQFDSDKERIKAYSKAFKNVSINEAFNTIYGNVCTINKNDNEVSQQYELINGKIYDGFIDSIMPRLTVISVPGIKQQIICKEHLDINVLDDLKSALQKVYFKVVSQDNDTIVVSILNAYYTRWKDNINKKIENTSELYSLDVYIRKLTKGGYLCDIDIPQMSKLTGNKYINSVFIPGSQIVLNIESDFEKWVGKTVNVAPQKFTTYQVKGPNGNISYDNCLICSRKKILRHEEQQKIIEIYNKFYMYQKGLVKELPKEFTTNYEGTITGIINSKNKCGAFIEITNYNGSTLTGMINLHSSDLVKYKSGEKVTINISGFDSSKSKDDNQLYILFKLIK